MSQSTESEIAIRDKLIKGLENELRIKEELIRAQKKMIGLLEEHNAELSRIIERNLKN